jgi:hypothetical protein
VISKTDLKGLNFPLLDEHKYQIISIKADGIGGRRPYDKAFRYLQSMEFQVE